MTDLQKLALFALIVGLSILAGKASARLARETGISALLIGAAGGGAGHLIAAKLS